MDNKSGSAVAELGPGTINIGGSGSSKLQSSFGNLKKQELDLQKLLQDSKSRVLDLQHSLIQQTRDAKTEVLAVVKERIITTQPCTITEEVQEGGSCSGMFGFNKTIKVSANDKGKPLIAYDTDVSIDIPPKTTLAYRVIELDVSHTGHYELCLLPAVKGGFEIDGPIKVKQAATVSAAPGNPIHNMQKELVGLQGQFTVLSKLSSSTRFSLFQQISLLLQNSTAISILESTLEDLCGGTEPDPSTLAEVPDLKVTLELIQKSAGKKPSGQHQKPNTLTATHLLISALDEMSKPALFQLKSCCSYTTLQALHHLVQNMALNKKSSLKDAALDVLADEEVFKKITSLFNSCNVMLFKEDNSLVTKISNPEDRLPLMLCVAVKGLASLAPHA